MLGNMFTLVNTLLLFCYVSISNCQRCSDESRKAANLCSDQLFFAGRNSRKYPENDQHVDKHCKETLELVRCVNHFTTTCPQGVHRPTTTVMLSTVRRNQRNYCRRPNKRQDLISLGICANAIRDQSTKCADKFMMDLGRASHSTRPLKIPQGCCSFFQLKRCVMAAAENLSGAKCSEKRRLLLERYMDSMGGNSVNMLCGQYDEESDRCSRLPPLPTGNDIASAPSIFTGFSKLLM